MKLCLYLRFVALFWRRGSVGSNEKIYSFRLPFYLMNARVVVISAVSGVLLSTGCAAYRVPSSHFTSHDAPHRNIQEIAENHSLYSIVPRHRAQLAWYDLPRWTTWALIGNDDDGIFGEGGTKPYSTNITWQTFFSWSARNPLHNLDFYVLGSAGWKSHFSRNIARLDATGIHFGGHSTRVFGEGRRAAILAFHDYKPFFSWNIGYGSRQFEGYIGWRPNGAFGIKFRPAQKAR